jgi:hypothetical protein
LSLLFIHRLFFHFFYFFIVFYFFMAGRAESKSRTAELKDKQHLSPDERKALFNESVIEALTSEAKKAAADNDVEEAYLFGVDWERIGHGKAEGPGSVLVARGLAHALIKLRELGHDKISDYLDWDEFDQLRKDFRTGSSTTKAKNILDAAGLLKEMVLQDDYGLRVWNLATMKQ